MKAMLFRGASPRPPSHEASPHVLRRTSRTPSSRSALGAVAQRAEAPRVPHSFALVRATYAAIERAITTAVAVVIGGSSSVLACPVCFGAEETSMVDGTKVGVLVMLAITLTVQGGFVGFFLYLRKRAKRIADVELDTEWSELQRPSRTS